MEIADVTVTDGRHRFRRFNVSGTLKPEMQNHVDRRKEFLRGLTVLRSSGSSCDYADSPTPPRPETRRDDKAGLSRKLAAEVLLKRCYLSSPASRSKAE